MHSRQEWLLALLLVLLAALSLAIMALNPANTPGETYSNRAVDNSHPSGYKAWWLAAGQSGLSVTPWRKSFGQLDDLPYPATMLLIEPFTVSERTLTLNPDSLARLLHWVRKGNTVIVMDEFRRMGTAVLPHALGLSTPQSTQENRAMYPLALSGEARAAGLDFGLSRPLQTRSDKRFFIPPRPRHPTRPLLVDANGRPVVIEVQYGLGRIILGTPADLASNAYLRAPVDNYQAFTNLASWDNHPVFANEYVHGQSEVSDIFAYYREKTPLDAMALQLLFAFGFLLWYSLANRAAHPPETEPPGTEGELAPYIQSLAGLYWRQQASVLALQPALDSIESLLRKRYRLELADGGPRLQNLLAGLAAEYSSKDESPARWLDSLKRARQVVEGQQRIEHRELLRLCRQLASIEHALKEGHPHVFTG